MPVPPYNAITDIEGIKVGHWTDLQHGTGCTVVLCEDGAVGGVDVRGGAPGTRETDPLTTGRRIEQVHGVLLSGGSAYGLEASAGVMRYLEERNVGFHVGSAVVPLVPAAIIFDLGFVASHVRPGPDDGYRASQDASGGPVARGNVGAGTGATVGKALRMERAMKGGLGTASVRVAGTWTLAALAVVNAFGDVVDPQTGDILAGPMNEDASGFHSTTDLLVQGNQDAAKDSSSGNTTLVVVATDARLTKEQANLLAKLGHDGLARAVHPSHLMRDGDTVFALATGHSDSPSDMDPLLAAVPGVVASAIVDGVLQAETLGGIPCCRDVRGRS